MVTIVLQPVGFWNKTASLYYNGKVSKIKTFLQGVNPDDYRNRTSVCFESD
jgi:hypothetical protein